MSGKSFFLVFVLLAALDFFVPFYLLDDVARFWGSYLFWSLLALLVIVAGAFFVRSTWGSRT